MNNTELHLIATRFLTYVNKDQVSQCEIFTGAKRHGYGVFRFKGRAMLAHRVSYLLFVGQIPEGKLLSHSCNNKPCVSPKHLTITTHGDVIRRAHKQGRFSEVKNKVDRSKQLKLNWALADQIRKDPRNNCTQIAIEHGLSRSTVSDIRRGKTWNRDKRKGL